MSIILIRGVWLRRVISWACGEWLPGPPNSPEEKKGHLWVFKALKETFRVSKPDEGKCSRLALGLFLVQATGTKSNKLSGLNNKAYISCSYGNWKSKIKVLVDLVSSEVPPLDLQTAGFSLLTHVVFPLCKHAFRVYVQLSFLLAAPCGLWDLSSPTRGWTWAKAVKAQNPSH